MSPEDREAVLNDVLDNPTLFNESADERLHNKSLSMLMADPSFSVYFGEVRTPCYNNYNRSN
jgi:hypothetical protein